MTTSADLLTAAVAALKAANVAAGNVYAPRDWPTWQGNYPVLLCQAPHEEGQSWGRNAPAFTVTATLHIEARVQVAPTGDGTDAGAGVALAQLQILRDLIKATLINAASIMPLVQQYPFFRASMKVDSSGEQHLGELVLELGLEFVQGPEDFAPPATSALEIVEVTVVEPTNTIEPGLTINLPQ